MEKLLSGCAMIILGRKSTIEKNIHFTLLLLLAPDFKNMIEKAFV